MSPNNPLCFAADFPDMRTALIFIGGNQLHEHVGAVKVGLELFISSGPHALDVLTKDLGMQVVLDLKLHDIPETVARAVKAGGDLGAKMMTIHIQQRKTLEMAVKAAEPYGITLLGVTVLTSMTVEDFKDLSYSDSDLEFRVYRLARFAYEAGLRGFVCSPQEVAGLKKRLPDSFFLVPGVRPAGSDVGDQKRVGTPAQAVQDGANLIVVGRPIRDAQDPLQAAKDILSSLQA